MISLSQMKPKCHRVDLSVCSSVTTVSSTMCIWWLSRGVMRNRFIWRLWNEHIEGKLLAKKGLTLKKAVKLASALEATETQTLQIQSQDDGRVIPQLNQTAHFVLGNQLAPIPQKLPVIAVEVAITIRQHVIFKMQYVEDLTKEVTWLECVRKTDKCPYVQWDQVIM